MPIFIELVTDAFEEVLGNQVSSRAVSGSSSRAGNRIARRPTRGLEIKEDTYAAVKVILSNGSELPLVDSSSPTGFSTNGYSNFMLQSVTEARVEKHQLVETFGASYIYFFGENPRFLDVTAVIINSHDFNWEAEWWKNYEENFRGTRLVEKGGRLYMFYDDNIVEGYMLMCQATKQSSEPHMIPISFRLFLTNYRNVSFIGDPNFPVHEGAVIFESPDVTRQLSGPARDQATLSAGPDRQSTLTRAASQGSFATSPRLSELLRDASRTGGTSPDAARLLGGAVTGRTLPIRSKIADNLDEIVGLSANSLALGGIPPAQTGKSAQSFLSPGDRARLETDDLHQETITQLGARGADVDDPTTLSDLGMMPNFESDARSPATFRPKEKQAFGFDTGGETASDDRVDPTSSFRQDPLGAVFGGSIFSGSVGFNRESDNRFTEGVGDAKYGFRSEFSSGPGFGEAGDGSFGGPGFGSAQGAAGDPGFKDPSRITFGGVAQSRASINKLRRSRPDQTVFGKGAGLGSSSSGLSGGASVKVGGKLSSFSLISVPGSLKL